MEDKFLPKKEDNLGAIFEEALKSQGRTKRWTAQQLGISEGYLCAMMKGYEPLKENFRARLNDILNTDI